jgi:predicted RNA-binding protein with PIN domain
VHYLVDTYNLVHAAAAMGGPLADMTVRKLCTYLRASAASVKVTLVLDGRAKPDEPSENEFPDVALVYSGAGVTADAVIAQRVEQATSRKKLTVVSNDRAVAAHARRHHAAAISCETFLRQLTQYNPRIGAKDSLPPRKVTGTPTPGESDHWMKEFGLQPPDAKKEEPRKVDPELGGMTIEDLLGPRGQ